MFKQRLVVVVIACLLTLSGTLHAGWFSDSWVKFRDTITLKNTFKSWGRGLSEGARSEFEAAMNELFDKKLQPLIADIDTKLQNLITKSGSEANKVIDHASASFLAIEAQVKRDSDAIINSVDAKYRDALRETFAEFNKARADAIAQLRSVIGDTDTMLEQRIDQVALVTMQALAKAEDITNNFTPGKFRTDLVDPTLQQLTTLEQDIFKRLDLLVEKVACTSVGGFELAANKVLGGLNEFLDRIPLVKQSQCGACGGIWQSKCNLCCSRVKMADPNSPTIVEKYRLGQCRTLVKLEGMSGTDSSQDVSDAYADLNVLARLFYCSGQAIQSNPMIREGFKDAIRYDELWQLWAH